MVEKKVVTVLLVILLSVGILGWHIANQASTSSPPPTNKKSYPHTVTLLRHQVNNTTRKDLIFRVPHNVMNLTINDWNNGTRIINATVTTSGKPYYSFSMVVGYSQTLIFPLRGYTYVQHGTWYENITSEKQINVTLQIKVTLR